MLKPNLLRENLVKFAPEFKDNPDRLEVYVTQGTITATGTPNINWLTEYDINVFVMDFSGELNHLITAILTWAKQHQPDLMFNPDKRKTGIRFDADILDNDKIDVLFTIKADERTYANVTDQGVTFETPLEPSTPGGAERLLPDWQALIDEGVIRYANAG